MNSNSKKTLVVTSALCALLAVGGTVAYFTDRDDASDHLLFYRVLCATGYA